MMKRLWSAVIALSLVLFGLAAVSVPAQASSDYDDFIHVTPTLSVYANSTKTETLDITATWWADIKQSYERRMVHSPSGWPTNFVSKFEEIVANGGAFGVYVFEGSTGKLISLFASSDANTQCGFTGPSTSGDVFECSSAIGSDFVTADYITHASYGNNGCGGNSCSDNGMNIYGTPVVVTNSHYVPYFIGAQNSNADQYSYFILNANVTYPTGYDGDIIPSSRNTASGADYVAMGDSYSSGEGNSPFESLSAMDGIDECHRSLDSYPNKLVEASSPALDNMVSVACSGATTDTVLNGGVGQGTWNEGPQVDALDSSTSKVTITIGGNDVGFAKVLKDCVQHAQQTTGFGCSTNTAVTDPVQERLDALAGDALSTVYVPGSTRPVHSIEDTLHSISTEAENATIYIAGYPHLFGASSSDYSEGIGIAPGDYQCFVHDGLLTSVSVSFDDAQWINDKTDELNQIIEDAVSELRLENKDVVYIDPVGFDGHGLCDSGSSFIYPLSLDGTDPLPGSFHPTEAGAQYGYAWAFLNEM